MEQIKNSNGEVKACVWAPIESVEQTALDQIYNIMDHPRLFKHVAIMPDVHG